MKYKAVTETHVSVNGKEKITKSILKNSLDISVKPYEKLNNSYTLTYQFPKIVIHREKNTIDLSKCRNSISTTSEQLLPFLSVYNENGLVNIILLINKIFLL